MDWNEYVKETKRRFKEHYGYDPDNEFLPFPELFQKEFGVKKHRFFAPLRGWQVTIPEEENEA